MNRNILFTLVAAFLTILRLGNAITTEGWVVSIVFLAIVQIISVHPVNQKKWNYKEEIADEVWQLFEEASLSYGADKFAFLLLLRDRGVYEKHVPPVVLKAAFKDVTFLYPHLHGKHIFPRDISVEEARKCYERNRAAFIDEHLLPIQAKSGTCVLHHPDFDGVLPSVDNS